MNINYASIFYYLEETEKINYLKEINIYFNKIKRLTIIENEDYEDEDENNINKKQKNNFFEILFSINNIYNNLIYLNIKLKKCKIDPELFENINKFKLLRYLLIEDINFNKDFIIKLNKLKLLNNIMWKYKIIWNSQWRIKRIKFGL